MLFIYKLCFNWRLKKQKLEAEEAFLKEQKVLNAILHLKGLNSEGTRESIKELFDNHAQVRFVDYNKGNPEAFVRFAKENDAKEALAKALEASGSNEIVLKEAKLECRVLEGEEEAEYWTNLIRKLAESRSNKHGKHQNTNRRRRNDNGYKNKGNKKKRSLGDGSNGEDEDDGDENENDVSVSKKVKAEWVDGHFFTVEVLTLFLILLFCSLIFFLLCLILVWNTNTFLNFE